MITPRELLRWIAGVLIALVAIVYAGDFAWFEYRMERPTANNRLETVTFYYATDVKGGKVEIFDAQPATEICVHAISPHQGYTPCWRLDRSHIKRISFIISPKDGAPCARVWLHSGPRISERSFGQKARPQDDNFILGRRRWSEWKRARGGCGHGDGASAVFANRAHGEKVIIGGDAG